MRKQQAPPQASASKPLSVNDLLFLNAYFVNGRHGRKAYQTVHPNAKGNTADTEAWRILKKPEGQAEIATRVTYSGGITREFVQKGILLACDLAEKTHDADVIERSYMAAAKLAGLLIEKREDVTDKKVYTREQLMDEMQKRVQPLTVADNVN